MRNAKLIIYREGEDQPEQTLELTLFDETRDDGVIILVAEDMRYNYFVQFEKEL